MDIVTYALLNGKIKNYASNVDEWLEENVDPDTGYVLDRSLQMENAAAPADMVGDINDEVGNLKNTLNHKADVIYDTASGDIASFPDGADGLPVKDLTVGIEPVQSGTGDPSPTNVRPISGWTGCNISHSGADTSDPTVIPISWQSSAGTVYGGTLDVTTGVLTVEKEYVEYDGSNDESWFKYNTGSSSGFAMGLPGAASGGAAKFISNYLSYIPAEYTWGSYDGWFSNDGVNLITGVKSVTTVENWKSYLQNSPLAFVKPLATPQTYQLAPEEVTTLLGQNNIWADCGPSTVEYPCDTKLYIQKINTPTDDDMIADANIASGQYFIVNNNLYLSTAAILAGDPIKPGTNCILTNLAAALNAINS